MQFRNCRSFLPCRTYCSIIYPSVDSTNWQVQPGTMSLHDTSSPTLKHGTDQLPPTCTNCHPLAAVSNLFQHKICLYLLVNIMVSNLVRHSTKIGKLARVVGVANNKLLYFFLVYLPNLVPSVAPPLQHISVSPRRRYT